jgi:hypothetical protein
LKYPAVTTLLLEIGADPDIRAINGMSPLLFAIHRDNWQVVPILLPLAQGPDLLLSLTMTGEKRPTVHFWATMEVMRRYGSQASPLHTVSTSHDAALRHIWDDDGTPCQACQKAIATCGRALHLRSHKKNTGNH